MVDWPIAFSAVIQQKEGVSRLQGVVISHKPSVSLQAVIPRVKQSNEFKFPSFLLKVIVQVSCEEEDGEVRYRAAAFWKVFTHR